MTAAGAIIRLLLFLGAAATLPIILEAKTTVLAQAGQTLAMMVQLPEGDEITGIVVLGGSVARVREAMKLGRRYPQAEILLTGAGEAEITFARLESAFPSRIILELRAKNTFENARFSKSLAQPRPGQRWVLVTSAVHMPRALSVFCAAGFPVDPWPVQDTPKDKVEEAQQAQHELLGLLAYRLLGRTRAFVTSPRRNCLHHSDAVVNEHAVWFAEGLRDDRLAPMS